MATVLHDVPAQNAARNTKVLPTRRFMPWSWWKVLFGSVLAGHALVRLLSHWSVGVRSIVAFKACPKWSQATHCKVSQDSILRKALHLKSCFGSFAQIPGMQVLPGTFAGKKDIVEVQRRAVVSVVVQQSNALT